MLIVREPRSQQSSGLAGDSQGHDGRLSHQTAQQKWGNVCGGVQVGESQSLIYASERPLFGVGCDMRLGIGSFVRA